MHWRIGVSIAIGVLDTKSALFAKFSTENKPAYRKRRVTFKDVSAFVCLERR